ncbi:MAG: Uma2 family endonuclease [Aggregatilineales bacterium]
MENSENKFITEADYLVYDEQSEFRHEYVDGRIIRMAGASRSHNLILSNINTRLNLQLETTTCEVYSADMRVQTREDRKYRYPDVVVVCETPQFVEDVTPDTLINPVLLVEILSESTASTDRVKKLDEYQQIDTVKDYLMVAQDKVLIIHVQRDEGLWLYRMYTELSNTVEISSVNCVLKLEDIYRKVVFSPDDDE